MKALCMPLALLTILGSSITSGEGIGCPEGATPKGERMPEVSEAWCELKFGGKVVMHGPYRAWWSNGRLGTEGQYQHGKAIGLWRGWYESGEFQGEEWFENGIKVKSRYFDKHGNEINEP